MQSSSPRPTWRVRRLLVGVVLAAAVTGGCQRGSTESAKVENGNRPTPIPGGVGDDTTVPRPGPDVATKPARPTAESPELIPEPPAKPAAKRADDSGGNMPDTAARSDSPPPLEPPATSPPVSQPLPTPSAATDRPAEVAPDGFRMMPPASLHRPSVELSVGHAQTCRVQVGDPMPDFSLPDQGGTDHSLAGLLSDKLTVVLFWSMREALGREQFRRLQRETYLPFHQAGVNVIAVHVGEGGDEARALYEEAQAPFPCLLDANKLAFTAVATDSLPRTYLLDAKGQVLWMDIFYARQTRRELFNAIHYYLLQQQKQPAS